MSLARSLSPCARPLLAAWLAMLGAFPALAQDLALDVPRPPARDKGLGLKLTLQPADFPDFITPAPPPRLDLTLRWDNLPTPAGTVSLFAGRSFGAQGPAMPGLVAPDADLRSPSDLMYVGVQFEGGARLRLKRSGDGLKLSYRASF